MEDAEDHDEWRRRTRMADPSPEGEEGERDSKLILGILCDCIRNITHHSMCNIIVTRRHHFSDRFVRSTMLVHI